MPKMNKGNVIDCLNTALHHVAPHKARLISRHPRAGGVAKYYYGIIEEELTEIFERLDRIKRIAEEQGNQEILSIFEEQFEYGHDLPE